MEGAKEKPIRSSLAPLSVNPSGHTGSIGGTEVTQNTKRFRRKHLVLVAVVLLLIASVGVWVWPKFYWSITVDSCLDMGGRWNYDMQECEGQRR